MRVIKNFNWTWPRPAPRVLRVPSSRPRPRGVLHPMPMLPDSVQSFSRPPFRNYQFDAAYDEMFEAPGLPRPHYQALFRTLLELPPEELRKSQQAADLSFLHQGITFTVYGNDQGTERVFPNDLLPRTIPADEWRKVGRALTQRITPLIFFLGKISPKGQIRGEGIVPKDLVYSCRH